MGLDILGAGLLAYDVLTGPEARLQAAVRHNRLAFETRALGRARAQLKAVLKESNPPEKKVRWLRGRIAALTEASESTRAELDHFENHDVRARRIAFVGLMALMSGFACQALAVVLSLPTSDVHAAARP